MLETWKVLVDDSEWSNLIEHAAQIDPGDVAAVARLREIAPAAMVRSALELANARRKAAAKFPDEIACRLIADVPGIEMASSKMCADYKADRFAQSFDPSSATIHDLCCGVGGDAISLAARGFEVIAVDQVPLRAWMAQRNAGCASMCADVESLDQSAIGCFHLDPSRRSESGRRRAWRFEDYRPGPEFISKLRDTCRDGAIKLGPGIDLDSIPRDETATEVEFISENGRLTQAVLWSGQLATSRRRATLLPARISLDTNEADDRDNPPIADRPMRYLYTFDASIERARLIGKLCDELQMPMVHPAIGLLTSDALVDHPWVRAFELVEQMPWQERRVRRWLSANDGGLVEIKTRGRIVDPDQLQARLRGKGSQRYVLFILRIGRAIQCFVTKRCGGNSEPVKM